MAMRMPASSRQLPAAGFPLPASGSQLSFQTEIQAKKWHVGGVMLAIERELAGAVRGPACLRARSPRSSAQVGDRRHWRKQYLAPAHPDRVTEIHVFGVEKEPFVEQSHGFRVGPVHEQARPAHPIHELLARRFGLDPRGGLPLLPELVPRR